MNLANNLANHVASYFQKFGKAKHLANDSDSATFRVPENLAKAKFRFMVDLCTDNFIARQFP